MALSGLELWQPAADLGHVAFVHGHRSLSYQELHRQNSGIAKGRWTNGVRVGDRVVVLTKRCLEMPILFAGVLKAGACYVPLDVEILAIKRVRQMIKRVDPVSVVRSIPHAHAGHFVRDFDHLLGSGSKVAHKVLAAIETRPEVLAYIIFTSGTTSTPEGVVIPRRALANYVRRDQSDTPFNMGVTRDDTVLCIFSPAFDACTGVIFSTLHNGGTVLVSSSETLESDLEQCSILPCTPSIRLLATLDCEQPFSAAKHRACTVFNCYGPSETTCASLISKLLPDRPIDLGLPMQNSMVILMKDGVEGTDGEFWISGLGLASGYLADLELTATKFVQLRGELFHRTGDCAQKKHGRLLLLGRGDGVVRNRGFLVNLDMEVVPAPLAQQGVLSAVALHYQGRLYRFVTPASVVPHEIRARTQGWFHAFVVADVIVSLGRSALTQNGKIDTVVLRTIVSTKTNSYRERLLKMTASLDVLKYAVQQSLNARP